MPDCAAPGKRKCGVPCTEKVGSVEKAWFQDCETKRRFYGDTYEDVRNQANNIKRVKAAGKLNPPLKVKKHPISLIKTTGAGGEIKTGAGGSGRGSITVKPGSRFDKIPNNWKDTEKLLGDPEPDDDPSTVGGFGGGDGENCFGIPLPCPALAIGVGALVVLLVVLR